MHYDHTWNLPGSSNQFMNMDEEESEFMRLRKLMHENILRVEKENLETVQRQLSDPAETAVKHVIADNNQKKIFRPSIIPPSASLKTKSLLQKGSKCMQPKSSEIKGTSRIQLPSSNKDHVCKCTKSNCNFSSVHFLNHLHSAFVSSKLQTDLQFRLQKDQFTPCAVPLAPPCQEKESTFMEQRPPSQKDPTVAHNNVIYHVKSEEISKKLTVQALPSISIIGKKHVCNENVRLEEIKERSYYAGDGIKTTVLPASTENVIKRISNKNLSSVQLNETSPSKIKNDHQAVHRPKKSIFTQSSTRQCSELPDVKLSKEYVKEMVKEALQEFQFKPPQECLLELSSKEVSTPQQEPTLIPTPNDCELDSFIGDVDPFKNSVTSLIAPNISLKSNYTQTSCDLFHTPLNEKDVEHLIQKIIIKLQQNTTSWNKETSCAFEVEKVHRQIQTSPRSIALNQDVRSHVSKEVQVSLLPEKTLEDDEDPRVNGSSSINNAIKEGNLGVSLELPIRKNLSEPSPEHHEQVSHLANNVSEIPVSSELSSKLDAVFNFISERFCKETGELSLNPENIPSSSSTLTRDVSVQYNPITTSTKSTCTFEVNRADATNQCDILSPCREEKKDTKDVSVQVLQQVESIPPAPEKLDSSVQCEQHASVKRDSCVQTVDFLGTSDNSPHTSVSSTPVSDSIFMDDMLSEGEVFLPWNLRLLSYTDKTLGHSSNNMAESSDKEKDYSLSEGEIPPRYLQQMNMVQSPSYDSSSDTCTDAPGFFHNRTTSANQSHVEIQSTMQCLQRVLPSRCSHCHTSSSSLSEGEYRSSSTLLSEGELPRVFPRQNLKLKPNLSSPDLSSIADGTSQCESGHIANIPHLSGADYSTRSNFRHSSLDFSEGEVIRRPEIPFQSTPCSSILSTVSE